MNKKLLMAILPIVVVVGSLLYLWSNSKSKPNSNKTYHVGVLSALELFSSTTDGFKTKMAELGYIEGKNIVYDVQKAPSPVGNEAIAQKFVDDKVDLILTFPTEASLETKKVTEGTNIPIIFANASLDGVKLVDSVRAPGANITGVQFPTTDNAVQRLELLHEIVPSAKKIWVPYLKGYPIVPPELERLRPAAQALGLTLVEFPATSITDIQADFNKREKAGNVGIDAILIIPEPLTVNPAVFDLLSSFGARHNIPMGGAGAMASTKVGGSLFSYIPSSVEVGKQAAVLADKIFKGTPAGTIPVVSPENNLTINYALAQKMGIKISEALLSRAKEIIR